MEGINKKKANVIIIYILHLAVYFLISIWMINKMTIFENNLKRLDKDYILTSYNHIYLSLFYLILSTYFTLENFDFNIGKITKTLVYIISLFFFFISLFKYSSLYNFINMVKVCTGLLISINLINRNISRK